MRRGAPDNHVSIKMSQVSYFGVATIRSRERDLTRRRQVLQILLVEAANQARQVVPDSIVLDDPPGADACYCEGRMTQQDRTGCAVRVVPSFCEPWS